MKSFSALFISLFIFIPVFANPDKPGDIKVQMTGMKNDKGFVVVGLYKQSDGFPFDAAKAYKGAKAKVKNGKAVVSFKNIPAGTYAIAVLHDEDDNMKMARKVTGLPDEEYGFSNDAKAIFGPPNFDKASFEHKEQQVIHIQMKL